MCESLHFTSGWHVQYSTVQYSTVPVSTYCISVVCPCLCAHHGAMHLQCPVGLCNAKEITKKSSHVINYEYSAYSPTIVCCQMSDVRHQFNIVKHPTGASSCAMSLDTR